MQSVDIARISRRNFLLASSAGAGALLAGMGSANTIGSLGNAGTLVVARRDGTINEMVSQCVESLGGIGKFVPAGSKVAIKVVGSHANIYGITNSDVVREVVRLVRTADPESVTVYEHPPPAAGLCWQTIEKAARNAGADAVLLREDPEDYVMVNFPGEGMTSTYVARVLHEADVLINVPFLHNFGTGDVSIGLKNHVGSVLYRGLMGNSMEGDLPVPDLLATPHSCAGGITQGIADLNSCPTVRDKHRLTIVDALRPNETHKWGHSYPYNGIIAGTDPVATDYVASQVLRRYFPSVSQNPPSIERAAAQGLGTNDPNQILFDERSITEPIPEFELPLSIAAMAGLAALAHRSTGYRHEGEAR